MKTNIIKKIGDSTYEISNSNPFKKPNLKETKTEAEVLQNIKDGYEYYIINDEGIPTYIKNSDDLKNLL